MKISDAVYRIQYPYLSGDLKSVIDSSLKVWEGHITRIAHDYFVVQVDYILTWNIDKKQWHKAKARPIDYMHISDASVHPEPHQEWYTTLEAAVTAKLLAIKKQESYVHKTVSEVLKNLKETTKGVDCLLEDYKNNFPDLFV